MSSGFWCKSNVFLGTPTYFSLSGPTRYTSDVTLRRCELMCYDSAHLKARRAEYGNCTYVAGIVVAPPTVVQKDWIPICSGYCLTLEHGSSEPACLAQDTAQSIHRCSFSGVTIMADFPATGHLVSQIPQPMQRSSIM